MAAAPLIWINAFPGVGKLTIARILASHFEANQVTLIDNHQLIDPVAAKFPREHPEYQSERREQRELVFKKHVANPATLGKVVIFTDFQTTSPLGTSVAQEYEAAAQRSGRPFIPVYLECELQENIRRIASTERKESGTTKLLCPELLREMRSKMQLYRFEDLSGHELDVSNVTPQAAAELLFAEIVLACPQILFPLPSLDSSKEPARNLFLGKPSERRISVRHGEQGHEPEAEAILELPMPAKVELG